MEFEPLIRAAVWGFLGAFIYAGQRWVVCLFSTPAPRSHALLCFMEMAVALVVGAIAAAAASGFALTTLHLKDENFIATLIGLCANVAAPRIVERVSGVMANTVGGRISQALGKDEHDP